MQPENTPLLEYRGTTDSIDVMELEYAVSTPILNNATLHFSSPQVETIIKDTQVAMMLNDNPMTKKPLVTLNK